MRPWSVTVMSGAGKGGKSEYFETKREAHNFMKSVPQADKPTVTRVGRDYTIVRKAK